MKKRIFILLILILMSNKLMACDCEKPKIALELYNSEYVFTGRVVQKIYSNDLSTYTITVDVIKHYKTQDSLPKEFKFSFLSKHNNKKTSCDFFIDKYENLLLYVNKNDNSYKFDLMCSNSKRITNKHINKKELAILDNANRFNINDYIIENEKGFNYSKPLTNVDSIINLYKNNKFEKEQFSVIMIDIDEKGKLINANLNYKSGNAQFKKVDTIFGLNYLVNKEYRKPKNNFERSILEISKKMTYWTPYKNLKTGEAIRHRKYLIFHSNSNGEIIFEN